MKTINKLNGNWKLAHVPYGHGQAKHYYLPETDTSSWLKASVPGEVHLDLMRAGKIPDPFYGLNIDHCLWMERKDWWYQRTFKTSSFWENKKIFMYFYGLDTFAAVYLNGKEIASHRNMFTPLEIDITNLYKKGENDIRVCLSSPLHVSLIKRDPVNYKDRAEERLYCRKAQMSFGWDIAPRLVTSGIWRPVEIIMYDRARILHSRVITHKIDEKSAEVELQITIENLSSKRIKAFIDIELAGQKKHLSLSLKEGKNESRQFFKINNPKLWWPNGYGLPNLYRYALVLKHAKSCLDKFTGHFGIRKIELVQEQQKNHKTSFYFKINDKRVFLKGINWTPPDAIFTRIRDKKYEMLLKLVHDTCINTLRVWGGGIYEQEIFYKLCDRLGIMVWQDFMFACGVYPQDKKFLAEIKKEAEHIVTKLTTHPSIIIWCGDNENDQAYEWCGLNKFSYKTNKINRKILPEVCARLDKTRPYIPSSPFSPSGGDPNCTNEGDAHLWRHGYSYKNDFYLKNKSRMVTEIGHLSVPDIKVLKSFMPGNKLWPPENEFWYMHCSDALRCGWNYRIRSLFESIKNNKAPRPRNVKELIHITQKLQKDAYVAWIKHFSADPECGGIILWNLCDCWPQISDACIAYPFYPKPVLQAVKEAYSNLNR